MYTRVLLLDWTWPLCMKETEIVEIFVKAFQSLINFIGPDFLKKGYLL